MDRFGEGYRRFRKGAWKQQRELFEELADQGQRPRAMVLGCCDSRVDPQRIFDVSPGELFVVRNVANLVPPYMPDAKYHGTSAALEFAVKGLNVTDIVVMGHGRCGGAAALMDGAPAELGDFLAGWVEIAAPARARVAAMDLPDDQRLTKAEHEIVKVSIDNLMTFPWVKERIDSGEITMHGFWFDIWSGELWRLKADGEFAPEPLG
jgi:carbonic anhydrase